MKYIYAISWLAALWLMSAAENGGPSWTGFGSLMIGAGLLVITVLASCSERGEKGWKE